MKKLNIEITEADIRKLLPKNFNKSDLKNPRVEKEVVSFMNDFFFINKTVKELREVVVGEIKEYYLQEELNARIEDVLDEIENEKEEAFNKEQNLEEKRVLDKFKKDPEYKEYQRLCKKFC